MYESKPSCLLVLVKFTVFVPMLQVLNLLTLETETNNDCYKSRTFGMHIWEASNNSKGPAFGEWFLIFCCVCTKRYWETIRMKCYYNFLENKIKKYNKRAFLSHIKDVCSPFLSRTANCLSPSCTSLILSNGFYKRALQHLGDQPG